MGGIFKGKVLQLRCCEKRNPNNGTGSVSRVGAEEQPLKNFEMPYRNLLLWELLKHVLHIRIRIHIRKGFEWGYPIMGMGEKPYQPQLIIK